jgi:adenosine deaminase
VNAVPAGNGSGQPVSGLPTAELHVHLEGCLEPEMALAFARRNGVAYPFGSVDEIVAGRRFEGLADFVRVMQTHSVTLVREADFYELTLGYLSRARQENILHAEMAMSPQGARARGLHYETMLEPVIAAFEDARRDLGITGGPIVACLRHFDPDDGFAMMRALKPYRDRILALGLHGPEAGYPPAPFARHFDAARDWGWRTVAHAGEEGPPEYIRQALDLLKVDRIDHGVACQRDDGLVRRLAEEAVPLTVCPHSNVSLGIFPSLKAHNLPALLSAGLNVSVHSDDPAYFGGYLGRHMDDLVRGGLVTIEDARRMCGNAIRSSFADRERKDALVAALEGAGTDSGRRGGGLMAPESEWRESGR